MPVRQPRVPLDWTMTTENLALAEEARGDRTGDAARWRAALGHAEAAMEVYQEAGAAFYMEGATHLPDRLRGKLAAAPAAALVAFLAAPPARATRA
jgi:hypothetical protein